MFLGKIQTREMLADVLLEKIQESGRPRPFSTLRRPVHYQIEANAGVYGRGKKGRRKWPRILKLQTTPHDEDYQNKKEKEKNVRSRCHSDVTLVAAKTRQEENRLYQRRVFGNRHFCRRARRLREFQLNGDPLKSGPGEPISNDTEQSLFRRGKKNALISAVSYLGRGAV